MLLVELRRSEADSPLWHYGFVGMSAESLRTPRRPRGLVFPAAGKVGAIDSRIWFLETPDMQD